MEINFSSLKEYIQEKINLPNSELSSNAPSSHISFFSPRKGSTEWVVNQIIADNEASSVQKALQKKGFNVTIKRQDHWEISIVGNKKSILKSIDSSGELYNSNKVYKRAN